MAERREPDDIAALATLDDPVRRRLYDFVAAHTEGVGRDDAAAAVGIGRPLAVYHLDRLVESGLLTASYQRPTGRGGPGAGRPAKIYRRPAREFTASVPGREYELAAQLLAQAAEHGRNDDYRVALRSAAHDRGVRLAGRRPAGRNAARSAQAALRELGYEPYRDEDGTIRQRNCPFHRLATAHRDLVCDMNRALVGGLLSGLHADHLRAEIDRHPGQCCVAITDPSAAT